MARLTIVAGTIVEAHRFINVPMRFGERYLARERRELWLRSSESGEQVDNPYPCAASTAWTSRRSVGASTVGSWVW